MTKIPSGEQPRDGNGEADGVNRTTVSFQDSMKPSHWDAKQLRIKHNIRFLVLSGSFSETSACRDTSSVSALSYDVLCVTLSLPHISFIEKWIPNVIISHRYKAQDTPARRTFEQALTGAFMSAVIKDLRPSALPFVASLIRHYTMVAVAQQCGEGLMLFRL